jgi:hypothetical protein
LYEYEQEKPTESIASVLFLYMRKVVPIIGQINLNLLEKKRAKSGTCYFVMKLK